MRNKVNILMFLLALSLSHLPAQVRQSVPFCWPQNWWIGMADNKVLLLLHGSEMALNSASVSYPGVSITRQIPGHNNSYLFVELEISSQTSPGRVPIILTRGGRAVPGPVLSLSSRSQSANTQLLNGSDAIYQIVPDRFVNGDLSNDNIPHFFERADRMNPSGVHGGDIRGIINALDYIDKLGITTIELTPLYESNQLVLSYEKFSPTNHYNICPHLGTVDELRRLVADCHSRGMKVILTKVLHKIGNQHILAQNPPFNDWINTRDDLIQSNPRTTVFADPYASQEDLNRHKSAWEAFDTPTLNHESEFLRRYLVQNIIWWVETSGVDGIRIDQANLNSPLLLEQLCDALRREFPVFNIISAPSTNMVVHNNFWKNGNGSKPMFTHVTDMPLNQVMIDAFAGYRNANSALADIYKIIASDLVYDNPANRLIIPGDGHDLTRLFTLADKDPAIFRMYIGFLLTTRGIPSFLYGTEIQMSGLVLEGSGFVRGGFPGGWETDKVSAFNQNTLSALQRDGLRFIQTLLNYRRANPSLMQDKIIHYEPRDEVYAYIRGSGEKKLLVIINNNADQPRRLESNRFQYTLGKVEQVVNVITGEISSGLGNLILNPKSIMILELSTTL